MCYPEAMIRFLIDRAHPLMRKDARVRPRRTRLGRLGAGPLPPLALMLGTSALWILLWYTPMLYYYPSYTALSVDLILEQITLGLTLSICIGGWATGLVSAAAGGPLIADEIEGRTWDVLAATPLTNEEIVRAKFVAGLWRIRHWLWAQVITRALLACTVCTVVVRLLSGSSSRLEWLFAGRGPTLGDLVTYLAVFAFMLLQPLLTAAAGVSLGMLSAAFTGSPALGRALALIARVGFWVLAWGAALYVLARVSVSAGVEAIGVMVAHLYAASDLTYLVGDDWLTFLVGLGALVLLLAAQVWLCLRLTAAALRRRRA